MPALETDPKRLIERHLAWMLVVNYSAASAKTRQRYLGCFADWCKSRDIIDFQDVTPALMERYQRHLFHYQSLRTEKALTFATQRYHLSNLREFFRWCVKKQILPTNPAADLDLPRVGSQLPKAILTVAEVEQVLGAIDLQMPAGVRDRAILEILYSTGIRRRELASLRLEDVDPRRGSLTVRQGKGAKDRMLPIGERALQWLEKYLTHVRPYLVTGEDPRTIFLNNRGRPLNIDCLSQTVRAHIRRAELGKSGSCHLFRHTMATLMLEGGADVRHVQAMLGHESLKSTQIYTHVAIHKLKEAHNASHPGAKLKPERKTASDDDIE